MLVTIAKYATGLFYLIMQQRQVYAAVDDTAAPFYQTIWNAVVLPNLIPLVVVLVLLEIVAGTLMLLPRREYAQKGTSRRSIIECGACPFLVRLYVAQPNRPGASFVDSAQFASQQSKQIAPVLLDAQTS